MRTVQAEQVYWTFSENGYSAARGYGVRAASKGVVADILSGRNGWIQALLGSDPPPIAGMAIGFARTERYDVVFRRTAAGVDRSRPHFVHALLGPVGSLGPQGAFDLLDQSSLWADNDSTLLPHTRDLQTVDVEVGVDANGNRIPDLDPTMRPALASLLAAVVAGRRPVVLVGPPDAAERLLRAVVALVPTSFTHDLTFSTGKVTERVDRELGTYAVLCTVPTDAGKGAERWVSRAVAIDCIGGAAGPLHDSIEAELLDHADKMASALTRGDSRALSSALDILRRLSPSDPKAMASALRSMQGTVTREDLVQLANSAPERLPGAVTTVQQATMLLDLLAGGELPITDHLAEMVRKSVCDVGSSELLMTAAIAATASALQAHVWDAVVLMSDVCHTVRGKPGVAKVFDEVLAVAAGRNWNELSVAASIAVEIADRHNLAAKQRHRISNAFFEIPWEDLGAATSAYGRLDPDLAARVLRESVAAGAKARSGRPGFAFLKPLAPAAGAALDELIRGVIARPGTDLAGRLLEFMGPGASDDGPTRLSGFRYVLGSVPQVAVGRNRFLERMLSSGGYRREEVALLRSEAFGSASDLPVEHSEPVAAGRGGRDDRSRPSDRRFVRNLLPVTRRFGRGLRRFAPWIILAISISLNLVQAVTRGSERAGPRAGTDTLSQRLQVLETESEATRAELFRATSTTVVQPLTETAVSMVAPSPSGPPPPVVKPGEEGERVRRLQQGLIARNLLPPRSDDSYYGPQTTDAMKRYQASRGREQLGYATADDERELQEPVSAGATNGGAGTP